MKLQDIKAGDEVILRAKYARERCIAIVQRTTRIAIVQRTTLTRIVVVGGAAYIRRTGRAVGATNRHGDWIEPATPENRERLADEIAEGAMRERLSDANHKLERIKVTEDNIAAIEAFLATQVVP